MKSKISAKCMYSFALCGFGYHLYVGVGFMYLSVFLTDVVGISAVAVGAILIVARFWDAINDPIIGFMVDQSKQGKFGKFRKFLIATPIPLAVFFVLCFTNLKLGTVGNIAFASFAYITFGMIYTTFEVSYWGSSSLLTSDSRERNNLISKAKLFQNIGIFIPIVLTLPIVGMLGGEDVSKGYFLTASVIAIVGGITTMLPGINIKEEKNTDMPKGTIKDNFKIFKDIVVKNKPVQILLLSYVPMILTNLGTSMVVYFFTYNINRMDIFPLIMVGNLLITILSAFLTPLLIKIFKDKRTLSIIMGISNSITCCVFFLVGYNSVTLVVLVVLFSSFGAGVLSVLQQLQFADCIEYNEWKFGTRSEATIFALKSFAEKVKQASGGLGVVIIGLLGYVANVAQTPETLLAIFSIMSIIPAIGFIFYAIAMKLYPLTDAKYNQVVQNLYGKNKK